MLDAAHLLRTAAAEELNAFGREQARAVAVVIDRAARRLRNRERRRRAREGRR